MAKEPIFKGPSEEEILQSLKGQSYGDISWKAATLVVVGIAQEPTQDEEHPILYSIARWNLDLKRFYPLHLQYQYGPTTPEYWMRKRHVTDEEGNLVFKEDEHGEMSPIGLHEAGQPEEYYRRMREAPQELLGEEYEESRVLDYEDPDIQEALSKTKGIMGNWYTLGKALIYRQPTGKYYNPTLHSSRSLVIAQMVQTIRNIFWTVRLPMAGHRTLPYHKISPDELHSLIFERLQTASVEFRKILSQNDTSDFEGGFLDYKVAVLEPRGVEGFYDSVEEALRAVGESYISEVTQEEPMALAASLSKEEVKILIQAADVLDEKAPAVANILDRVIKAGTSVEDEEFKKEDLVAALMRVANKLDEKGATAEANLADRLIKSIVTSERSCRKTKM